ncbi:hypothetical protein C922_05152 [Plasmodium inui San Antonio 1]|uniref:Uncharacterized protein n=1 Tax=Plasmodium inui San Antonio 1 TaxID=1237626 RepID=W7A5V1_9APIC|nr:hypothetical protein C922_05152 [Plasmodium inui San Antonio 1]EUD64464.1 hypothetical protein C922_05152 [Plasmodium inui San Antonio 1]
MEKARWELHSQPLQGSVAKINFWSPSFCNFEPNSQPFCYKYIDELDKESRWIGLKNWSSTPLGEAGKTTWKNLQGQWEKTEVVTGGAKRGNDWRSFIAEVFTKSIETATKYRESQDSGPTIWTEGDWYRTLEGPQGTRGYIGTTSNGQEFLGVFACILLTILKLKRNPELPDQNYPDYCRGVINRMKIPVNKWNSWIRTKQGSIRYERQQKCTSYRMDNECPEYKFALLLTVIQGLMRVCPSCGPYRLDYWLDKEGWVTEGGKTQYCQLESGLLTCPLNSSPGERPTRDLMVAVYKEPNPMSNPISIGSAKGSREESSTEALSPELQQVGAKGQLLVGRNLETGGGGGQKPGESSETPEATSKNDMVLNVSGPPAADHQQQQQDGSHDKAEDGVTSTPSIDIDDPSSGQSADSTKESSQETEETSNQVPETDTRLHLSDKEEPEAGSTAVGSIAGGVLAVMVLGALASYGFWRVYGRPRKRGRLRRVPTPRGVFYGSV